MLLNKKVHLSISIHTPHAGSDVNSLTTLGQDATISIHTPHAGSDKVTPTHSLRCLISIHTPHAGSDCNPSNTPRSPNPFQSTLPMRGATTCSDVTLWGLLFQSTLPMRGATMVFTMVMINPANFNPHSPCGERRYHRSEH